MPHNYRIIREHYHQLPLKLFYFNTLSNITRISEIHSENTGSHFFIRELTYQKFYKFLNKIKVINSIINQC